MEVKLDNQGQEQFVIKRLEGIDGLNSQLKLSCPVQIKYQDFINGGSVFINGCKKSVYERIR